jgi:two-component system sensor histidine kinase YesM
MKSFQLKLIFIFLAAAIALGALIGVFSYSHSKNIVVANKKKEMADTVNRIDININVRVRYIMDAAENATVSHLVQGLFLRKGTDEERSADKQYLDEYFQNMLRSFDPVNNIFVLDSEGMLYARYAANGELPDASRTEEYARLATDNPQKTVWTGIVPPLLPASSGDSGEVLCIVRAITGPDDDQVKGALVIELEQNNFSNLMFNNNGIWDRQYTVIADKQGEVICSNVKMDTSWLNAIGQRFERGEHAFTLLWEDTPYYVCGQYNGVTGWKTYSLISQKNLFSESDVLKREILFSVALCTLGVSLVIAFVAYAITRPINRLTAAMRSVEKQNFDIRLPNRRKDEFGRLTDSFNSMISRINTLVNEVYQEKLAQKSAEIKALQAQINPHFLYNTLDSINWMLIDRGQMDISAIVVSLGSLMRYCIDTKAPFVTLAEEFEYVAAYLRIQKNRLEERLCYELELPESVRDMRVPKFILQPLVENAIQHGIERYKRPGLVRIAAADGEGDVRIIVQDSGPGIPDAVISALEGQADEERQTGIGLYNVDKRLRLYYGEKHRLMIENTPSGVRIVITIPKEPQEGGL